MKCTTARDWIFRKIDGELSESDHAELEAHLAQCISCSREYNLFTLPHKVAQAIPPITPSPFFYRSLKARIDGEANRIASWQAFLGLARPLIPTLAGITLALLSIFAYHQINGPEAEVYRAYDKAFISEYQTRMLSQEQGEISYESILRAIADR
jgi:anti-sigma factor RsiW